MTVIVPRRDDVLIEKDGTPTLLFASFLESLTSDQENLDLAQIIAQVQGIIAGFRAEFLDRDPENAPLFPAGGNNETEKRIDDLEALLKSVLARKGITNLLTADELAQLQNINSVTITNAQWAFVGNAQIGSGSAVVASGTRRAPLGTINFPIAFTTAPKMNATIVSGDFILAPEAPATVMLRKITATEFEFFIDLHANAPSNRTMTFNWSATI